MNDKKKQHTIDLEDNQKRRADDQERQWLKAKHTSTEQNILDAGRTKKVVEVKK